MTRGLLLDTNIVSELQRSKRHPGLERWWSGVPSASLSLSVLTLGEIERGILRLQPRDPDRAARIRVWFDRLQSGFAGRIIPVDSAIARRWGEMASDRTRRPIDTLIAATAKERDLRLVTRNEHDFDGLGIDVRNPFSCSGSPVSARIPVSGGQ